MHSITLNIEDSVFEKVIYFLQNLPKNEVSIVENKLMKDDWSDLESEIDIGLNSGVNSKSHEEILSDIKRKYA